MVSIFTEKLNSLMGINRNIPLGQKIQKENYWDENVCKYFLVTICPHDLFPNTKYDLGLCDKRHDNFFKTQFHNDHSLKKMKLEKQYIEKALNLLNDRVQIVDNKVKKIQSKQDIALHKGEIPIEYQEKIDIVEQDIQAILQEMEKCGELGQFEKYEELSEKLEQLRKSQKHLQLIAVNPTLAAKQMKLCEICGAMQAINDVEKRNLTHLDGKLHKGFETIRKEIDRVTNKLESVLLKIEVEKEELKKKGKFVSDESSSEEPQQENQQDNYRNRKIYKNDRYQNNRYNNRYDNRSNFNRGDNRDRRQHYRDDRRERPRRYMNQNYDSRYQNQGYRESRYTNDNRYKQRDNRNYDNENRYQQQRYHRQENHYNRENNYQRRHSDVRQNDYQRGRNNYERRDGDYRQNNYQRRTDGYRQNRYEHNNDQYRSRYQNQLIMNLQNYQISIFYYLRKQMLFEAQQLSQQGYRQIGEEFLNFWNAYTLWKLGNKTQCLQILKELEGGDEINICVQKLQSIIAGEKQNKNEAIHWINKSEFAISNLIFLEYFENNHKKISNVIQQCQTGGYLIEGCKALIELDKNIYIKNSQELLIERVQRSLSKMNSLRPDNPLSYLIELEFKKKQKANFEQVTIALNNLQNSGIQRSIFLFEQCEQFIIAQKWSQLQDTLDELERINPQNFLYQKYKLLKTLVTSGDSTKLNEIVNTLVYLIENQYWNCQLYFMLDIFQLINSISANNKSLIKTGIKNLNKLLKIHPQKYELVKELAYSYLLVEDYQLAEKYYNQASKIDESKQDPFLKIVQIKIAKKELEEANSTLEFIQEIQSTLQSESSEVYFLKAVLNFQESQNFQEEEKKQQAIKQCSDYFNKALSIHIKNTRYIPNNLQFLKTFNPAFLVVITNYFMANQEISLGMKLLNLNIVRISEFIFEKCASILQIILEKIPGLISGYLLLVKAYILNDNLNKAQHYLSLVLEKDMLNKQAHYYQLLVAIIKDSRKNDNVQSYQILQESTSQNFELQKDPNFLFLQSQVQVTQNQYDKAQDSITRAVDLMDDPSNNITQTQMLEIKIAQAKIAALNQDPSSAKEIMSDIIMDFSEPKFSQLIILANCEINLLNNDIPTAIQILKNVNKNEISYEISKLKLADVYLNNLQQTRSYLQQYLDIVDNRKDQKNLELLADAYYKTNEYEKCLETLQNLEQEYTLKESYVQRMGQCYVNMHNFVKAKEFYNNKISQNENDIELILSYANLLCRLQKTDQLESLLQNKQIQLEDKLKNSSSVKDKLNIICNQKKINQILHSNQMNVFRQFKDSNNLHQAIQYLQQCLKLQDYIIELVKEENLNVQQQKLKKAYLHLDLIRCQQQANFEVKDYEENLEELSRNGQEDIELQIYHSELLYLLGDQQKSREQLRNILKSNPQEIRACKVYADCMLQKSQYTNGIKGFQKILKKEQQIKQSFSILTILIWYYRNSGKLNEFRQNLDKYKQYYSSKNTTIAMCEGLYCYFVRQQNKAIEKLFIAKSDKRYFDTANLILIDIYLHKHNHILYSNYFHKEKFFKHDTQILQVLVELIDDINEETQYQEKILYSIVMEFLLKNQNAEECYKKMEQLKQNKFFNIYNSFILYWLAIWSLKLKKKESLKENLIAIRSLQYNPINCYDEYFFKGLLLCADTLMNKDKLKAARNLVDKALNINKACLNAFDYKLILAEKEKEDIISIQSKAFEMTDEKDANIGYNLAKKFQSMQKSIRNISKI